MGKKRKLGQLEAAQPGPAEPKKQKPEQVVISVDDARNPLEVPKQIELIQSEVLPNPNEARVKSEEQFFNNPPVTKIEAGKAKPPPPKKQKQVDICVDVAGEASEPSKEVGLVQAKPAEQVPPNPTVGAESGAELSSNPVAEIEAKPAELPPQYSVGKGEVKSKEARMISEPNVEAKTEEVAVKKRKNKKQKMREQMEMQSAERTQCGDDVENNCEAKIIEEDESPKKRKTIKKQKMRELMEMQGAGTVCVNDVEKNGEAKKEEDRPVKRKRKNKRQKLRELMEMQGTVTTCVDDVAKSGNELLTLPRLAQTVGEVVMQSTVATQCVHDVEKNGEAKINEEDPVRKKKKKNNKKQKLGGLMEMQGTVTTCVDGVEKIGAAKNNGVFLKPVQVEAVIKGSKDPVTVCVGLEINADGKIDEGGEVAKLLAMHELTTEMQGTVTKLLAMHELTTEMQGTVTPCVDGVEKSGEAKNNGVFLKPVQVVAVMKGSKEPVTVCVGVENNVDGKFDEGCEVARLLAMHGLTMAVGEVENKWKENEMENTDNTCADVGNNDEVMTMPWLRERQGLILTSMEWRKKQLILGLQRKDGAKKLKEKKSTEEEVGQKKESRNEKAKDQTIKYPQVCVICRGKGHVISNCSLLNQTQTNSKKSGNKLPKCSQQPLQRVKPRNGRASNRKKKNGKAEKLLSHIRVKPKNAKASNRKKKNGKAEKLLGCPPEDTLVKDKSSDSKEGKSITKMVKRKSCLAP